MLDQPYKSYRDIGRELALHILAKPELSTDSAVLAALVSDFAASSLDQVAPLRDLMRRPGFQMLLPFARSSSGALQRDALVEELRPVYSESVMIGITEFINEFLDLPDSSIIELDQTLHTTANNDSPQVNSSSRQSLNNKRSSESLGSRLPLVVLSVAGLGVVAVAIQSPPLCSFLRLCSNGTLSRPQPRDEPLARAAKSARDVRAAKDRDELERALSQLDADLNRIDPSTLSQDQLSTLAEFNKLAADSRIPAVPDSAKQENLQPSGTPGQKTLAIPQPLPIDPVTAIPPAAVESEPQPQRSTAAQQTHSQPSRPKPVIQLQPAPPPRLEPEPTSPTPMPPTNLPVTRGETQGQKRYSLPPAWEERRARRREIMNNYSVEGAQ
jgi:hypothetical protein